MPPPDADSPPRGSAAHVQEVAAQLQGLGDFRPSARLPGRMLSMGPALSPRLTWTMTSWETSVTTTRTLMRTVTRTTRTTVPTSPMPTRLTMTMMARAMPVTQMMTTMGSPMTGTTADWCPTRARRTRTVGAAPGSSGAKSAGYMGVTRPLCGSSTPAPQPAVPATGSSRIGAAAVSESKLLAVSAERHPSQTGWGGDLWS